MIDPYSEETRGYHLFLMPEGKVELELKEVMELLTNTFQGSTFDPHVTLLAQILGSEEDLRLKAETLSKEFTPFTVELSGIDSEKAFFRALYLKVRNPERVTAMHEKALEVFGMQDESQYVPHLSLAYGNFPEDTATEMSEGIPLPQMLTFAARSLHLYRTEGTVENWTKIAQFPFGNA